MTASSKDTTKVSAAAELERHAASAASLLRALANPHRLQVLCVLIEGDQSVGALNRRVALSQSALSQHLAVLRADRLVRTRRAGQTILYRIEPGPAVQVLRVLHRHFCRSRGGKGPK